MNATSGSNLQYARDALREKQEKWAQGAPKDNSALEKALLAASTRESNTVLDKGRLRAGPFTYDAEIESRRLARSREIIERVSPGWAEDGTYLELLTRQAASIEMLLESHLAESGATAGGLNRIVLGTLGQPRSTAWTKPVDDCAVIAIAAGMMNAYYQLSKAVVFSWRPTSGNPDYAVTLDHRRESVERVLDENSESLDVAYECLASWFFWGLAQPLTTKSPDPLYIPPLQLLINYAERFVLGHEYCHALMDYMGYTLAGFEVMKLPSKDNEFRADLVGAWIVAQSASLLDSVPPNIALGSTLLAMKIHEIVDEALLIFGRPPRPSTTHPPFQERSELVMGMYQADYEQDGAKDESLSPDALLPPARTLGQIWDRIKPRFVEDAKNGRSLHKIWD